MFIAPYVHPVQCARLIAPYKTLKLDKMLIPNMPTAQPMRLPVSILLLPLLCTGCAVVTVADAAVSVAATTIKVGATVVETTVDVASAGVRAVVGDSEEKK